MVVSGEKMKQPRNSGQNRIQAGLEVGGTNVWMYRVVPNFTSGTTVTLGVLGDTTGGCKFQLLHREMNLSCCYSQPDRGDTLCDPASQSRGCRDGSNSRVHEVSLHNIIAYSLESTFICRSRANVFSPCLKSLHMTRGPTG